MRIALISLVWLAATHAQADPAQIIAAEATETARGWRFSVTILHPETGWDDYADGWRIEAPDGTILGERPLAHPHVDEQPFTRSLSGVAVPEGLGRVAVRSRTSLEGWGTETLLLSLR